MSRVMLLPVWRARLGTIRWRLTPWGAGSRHRRHRCVWYMTIEDAWVSPYRIRLDSVWRERCLRHMGTIRRSVSLFLLHDSDEQHGCSSYRPGLLGRSSRSKPPYGLDLFDIVSVQGVGQVVAWKVRGQRSSRSSMRLVVSVFWSL